MSRQARLERKRLLANHTKMLLRGLLMSALVSRKVVAGTKRFPALTLMIALLEMHGIDVHLHMWTLAKISVTVGTHPFLLATMSGCDVSLERITAVERVGAMLAVIIATCAVL